MTSPDDYLLEKLRKENKEQFCILVRMHFSFVVDFNTDDDSGDISSEETKLSKWNILKKVRSPTNSSQNKESEVDDIPVELISGLNELIEFLSKPQNVTKEGLFRRTGSLSRQQELHQQLITGLNLGLEDLGSKFSVHDCASVLKGYLAALPQPLLMDQYYQTYYTLANQYPPNAESSETKLLPALQLLLLLLTPSNRRFLQKLLGLLRLVADNEASNKMSPDTLATMFTPHLLCPRKLSPETFHTDAVALAPVLSFMIRHSGVLFYPPRQLQNDAAAYLHTRERRRQLSPTGELNESITERSAARTVYAFVDRPRTLAENKDNPTDTALAELYAHIRSLPDTQEKRRLVKIFNRQNGHGSPITGEVAGPSFGDSIKRRIFSKELKSPKDDGSSINIVDETRRSPKVKKLSIPPVVFSDEIFGCTLSGERSNKSQPKSPFETPSASIGEISPLRFRTACFTSSPLCNDSNTPCKTSPNLTAEEALSQPFREYLLSRSILTVTPVDLTAENSFSQPF